MPGLTNKDTVVPDPQEALKSTGISLRFKHYVHCIQQAQRHGISMSEYIRMLVNKDYEEHNKTEQV